MILQAEQSNRLGLAAWKYTLVISNLELADSGVYKVGKLNLKKWGLNVTES